jgi:hypothetical protein
VNKILEAFKTSKKDVAEFWNFAILWKSMGKCPAKMSKICPIHPYLKFHGILHGILNYGNYGNMSTPKIFP